MNRYAALVRSKPVTRYVLAVCVAIVLVITIHSLQSPHESPQTTHASGRPLPPPVTLPTSSERIPNPVLPPPLRLTLTNISSTLSPTSARTWGERAERVKDAFRHAYDGYQQYATGYDELRPQTKVGVNNFNGWNVTMYDSLDTMLLMGLNDYFSDTLPIIEHASFGEVRGRGHYAPFFETVIRYLGGLLAAYALSGERIILQKADELATLLEPAFNTPSGFPKYSVDTASGKTGGHNPILAEIASCQLEWTYLAHATGKQVHFEKSDKIMDTLHVAMMERKGGMLPTYWNLQSGKPTIDSVSPGAAADSGHEYLLKQYLLTAKTDRKSLEMYLLTTNHLLTNLVYMSPKRELLYVTDKSNNRASHRFEHLACFMPGLLALGAHTLNLTLADLDYSALGPDARRSYDLLKYYDLNSLHLSAAKAITTSCYLMYADQPSGLGPESVSMLRPEENKGLWIDAVEAWRAGGMQGPLPGLDDKPRVPYVQGGGRNSDYSVASRQYFLRPETLESIFLMWKTTGDVAWRERGWEIFEAIEKGARTEAGYGSVQDVSHSPARATNEMPSYFLAETLKYLYLLFSDEDLVPLEKWVFNTEAHPLPVFSWTAWEERKFGIPTGVRP